MAKFRLRVSLATKCQILFGLAVVLILLAALSVPWLRMQKLVEEGQRQIASRLADAWLADLIRFGQTPTTPPAPGGGPRLTPLRMTLIDEQVLDVYAESDPFLAAARRRFEADAPPSDAFVSKRDEEGQWIYRYVRAIRQADLEASGTAFGPGVSPAQVANPLRAMLLIEVRAEWAQTQLRINQLYLATAGLLAGILAIATFWFILTRIVLSPVRVLRDTAEKVAEGDLNIRSDINTGDEFEQLSETFNTMLISLKSGRDQLQDLNRQLDLKVGELAASNTSLYEANRLKGDFLASVSHELRTPLNSIIGFAEVLTEALGARDDPESAKRRRYAQNILSSSRALLQMITELLDLAKIEAGRIDLNIDSMAIDEVCESLLSLMRPQADPKGVALELAVARHLPTVKTDPGKFQQIIFNFLSNAIKFSPSGGRVVLGAEAVRASGDAEPSGVRVWVRDEGPGIPIEHQSAIFEKFRQLDATHTREHGGTGLGLAISTELAKLLQGRIDLESDVGRGSTFSLRIPLVLQERAEPLMPEAAEA